MLEHQFYQGMLFILEHQFYQGVLFILEHQFYQGVLVILEHQFYQGVLFILEHQFYQCVLSFGSENFCCMNFALNSLKKNAEMMVIANILLPLPLIMQI